MLIDVFSFLHVLTIDRGAVVRRESATMFRLCHCRVSTLNTDLGVVIYRETMRRLHQMIST